MSDREEICELHARYNHYMDSYDREAFVDLFTSDGSWELVGVRAVRGAAGLAEFIDGIRVHSGESRHRHFVFNEAIDVDGAHATARSYVVDWLCTPGQAPRLIALGRYSDKLRRDEGRWRFVSRRLDCDWLEARDGLAAQSAD
jgi:hypothetical protein